MNVRRTKILRDLLVNKSRSLLVILAVAVGVAAFGLMITGRVVLEENLRDGYAATQPAHTILSLSPFDDDMLDFVQAMDFVSSVQARRVDQARILSGPDAWLSFEIHTLPDFDSISINKLAPDGDLLFPPALHTILLERSLKNVMEVGDTIQVQLLNGDVNTLTVGGFVNDLSHLPSEISLSGLGYISLETADTLGLGDEYNQLLVIFADANTRTDVEIQTTQLVKDLEREGYQVFSAPVPVPGKSTLGDNMSSVLFILNALGVLTLILSAFLVTSVMSAIMVQQIPQIGILKSLGARIHQTMSLYVQEVLLFGVLALLLAIPMGLVGAYFLADGVAAGMNFNIQRFRLPTITLVLQALSALLAPLLASLFPIVAGSLITIREAISNYNPETAVRAGRVRLLGELPQLVNLSVRNTFRRRGRLALTFVALLLAGSMFIAIIGIRQSMREALREIQGDLNYDVSVDFTQPYSAHDIEEETINLDGVRALETWAVENGRLVFNADHLSGSIILYGVPKETAMARPGIIHGNWLSTDTPRGIFVNADFLDLSPSLNVGSVVTLNISGREEQWTILGSGGRGFIPVAYVYYEDLTSQTGLDGLANRLVIQTTRSDSAFQSNVQSDVLTRFDNVNFDILGSQTTTQLKETTAAQMDVLIILLLSMVVLIAIVGGLGLAITMSLNVIERTREIGILRSLGAQNGVVRRVVIVEGLVIGLISWAVSIPCSIPLAIWLGNSLGISLLARPLDYILSIPAVLMWLGLMTVIAVIASVVPAQSAARLTIRDALVYE
ncbi:MAG TPA: FtsX-like permease family protein [Anaerolineales bacterium]|nr:FtsX-like permease family protein [Anaerolineales bacterium]